MEKLSKEQNKEINKILTNPNDENRLIELKRYLSSFDGELGCDFAQLAYNIYMENKKPNNK